MPANDAKPSEGSVLADLTAILHGPHDMNLFNSLLTKDLLALQKGESAEAFQKDLAKLNQDLHEKHLLPYFELIAPSPDDPTKFGLENINDRKRPPTELPNMSNEHGSPEGGGNGADIGSNGGSDGGDGNGAVGGPGNGGTASRIADPGGAPWDGNTLVTPEAKLISDSALKAIGQQLWAKTPWAGACDGGNEGCAASVSYMLDACGINLPGGGDASVMGLAQKLSDAGWQTSDGAESAQPGCVIYGNNGGDDQHVGIVSVDRGQLVLLNNFSNDGQWHEEPLNSSYIANHFGGNVRVLHPPATSGARGVQIGDAAGAHGMASGNATGGIAMGSNSGGSAPQMVPTRR